MDLGQLLERLRSEVGVVAAEVIPDDLFSMIVEGERGVTGAMGSMPVINTGLQDCIDRNTRICIFEDDTMWHPDSRTMNMRDGNGRIVGHTVGRSEALDFMRRDDVVFLSDDFVMYPDLEISGTPVMELLAVPYRCRDGWIPEGMSPVLWYPCTTNSDMIHRYFGRDDLRTATGILALNLRGCP